VPNRELDAIVNEVVADAHINRELILPEEISYIREHVLRKPLRMIHIWALGVGVVIAGLYFGWNFGLPLGGPRWSVAGDPRGLRALSGLGTELVRIVGCDAVRWRSHGLWEARTVAVVRVHHGLVDVSGESFRHDRYCSGRGRLCRVSP